MANESGGKGTVLVYVDAYPRIIALLRTARRYAQRNKLSWIAVHSENRHQPHPDEKEMRIRILQAMTLAEEMGATVESVEAEMPLEGIKLVAEKLHARGTAV